MSRLFDIRESNRCIHRHGLSKVSYRSHAKATLATRLIMSKGGPRFYAPVNYGYGGCYVRRLVPTPWGPRWRLINRCY